jgi:protein Mpv17
LSDTRDVKNDDLMFFVSEEQEKNNTTAGFTEIIQTQSKTLGEETDEQHDMDRERMGNDVEELTHTHLLGRDETDLHHHLVSPSIPVSYDENGIVYADVAAAAVGMTQKMDNSILIDEQQDYPDFIKFLYRKDQNGQTLASKLFNFTMLAVSFGYVFFSVFNIDKGMTRGWSPSEIGMRIPLDTWASYENSLSEKPVATKTIINVVIYLLGDWLSQTLFQQKNVLDFDAARTIKNGLVGMCFGPAVHEYYEFSDWILPVDGVSFGITNRAFKILMDQTIYLSIKCSIYIIAIGVLNGDSLETGSENVKTRIKPIMFTAWKFWPLVHCVTYGLIPARHRILWVNSVDLVWNAILASKARGDVTEDRANDDDSQHNENEADKQQNNSGPII